MYEIFEKLLERDGVSVAEVCKATGVRPSTISNWKKRNTKLSAENAAKLAKFFNVSVGFLMGEQEDNVSKEYFTDLASAIMAQEMFDDAQLRALHHVKRNIDYERFKAYYDMIIRLYRAENPGDDYDFGNGEPSN